MKKSAGPVKSFPLAEQALRTAREVSAERRPDFDDTATTFAHLSDGELRRATILFRLMGKPWLTRLMGTVGAAAVRLRLPLARRLVRATIYRQFVGGRSLKKARRRIRRLAELGVDSILDYGAEAGQEEEQFRRTLRKVLASIDFAADNESAIGGVVKLSGTIPLALLERYNAASAAEIFAAPELAAGLERVSEVCRRAAAAGTEVYLDAEESWIQGTIDRIAETMMARHNTGARPLVFTTCQMYRHDRLVYLRELIARAAAEGWRPGVKLVRGAYINKENARAEAGGYPTPIQPSAAATHADYDAAVRFLFARRDELAFCLATHNRASTELLTGLMDDHLVPRDHPGIRFSQLLGMSDNLTFNLAAGGFNVSKYMVYGPVTQVLPYLVRRAQENTSVTGEAGRELALLERELRRRRQRN